MWRRLNKTYTQHQNFILLATLVTAFYLMALALLRPGGYIVEWWGYYMPHTGYVRLSDLGDYPYIDYWMEYPPLLSWLPIAAYRLSHLFPVWNHPYLWYNLIMGALLLPFEIGNLVLVYLIALKVYDRGLALRCAVFYAVLFVPLFTLLAWFDSFPLFFLLLGLYLLLVRRPILAGLATGAGFMTKLLPILLLPVGWRVFQTPWRKALLYTAVTILTILAIALPFLLIRADLFIASFVNMLTRPSWETVWALLDGYVRGGRVAHLEERFDPGTASLVYHSSNLPWPVITIIFGLIYLFIYTRRIDWQEEHRILTFTGLSLVLFMLYSKGYSPQFLIYILPFVVLLLPNWRGVAYSILLTVANYLDWPVAQTMLRSQEWFFASAILLRTLLLIGLAVEYSFVLFPALRSWKFRRALLRLPLAITLVATGIVGVLGLRAYFEVQYAQDPYREVIDLLQEQEGTGIVVDSESLYNRLFPYVGRSASLHLLGDDERSWERLEKLAAEQAVLWVVDISEEGEQAIAAEFEQWLSEHDFPMDRHWFDNARLTSYATGDPLPLHLAEANLEGQILLADYGIEPEALQAGQVVRLTLHWQALAEMEVDYTVFIHVVGPDGQIRSQRDGQPVGGTRPTSTWMVGEQILDNHALHLGAEAPPGEYQVVVGLYDAASGERLLLLDEHGEAQGDSILLHTITVSEAVR